jgi:hypothetical protein
MRKHSVLQGLALAAVLAFSTSLVAKPMAKSLSVTHPVHLGKSDVKVGDYRAMIDGNHLTLLNGKKTIAEAEGRWEDRDNKSQYNAIVADKDGRVIELRFEGRKSVFVITE